MHAFIPLRTNEKEFEIYTRYKKFLNDLDFEVLFGTTISKEDIDFFDLLLLPGGGDIYDNKANDIFDLSSFNTFYNNKKKIIGICRGLQVINFALGGSLNFVEKHESTHHTLKKLKVKTNSYHHQAIDKISKDLKVIDEAKDGTIEIISGQNVLAFQFHPELEKEKLYKYWIDYIKTNLLNAH